MPGSSTIRAVVWDVGNVIVRWDPRTLYSKIFPDPGERDRFLSSICTMDWHIAHDLGVTFEENRKVLIDRFPEHEAPIRAWGDRWFEMFSGVHAPTVEAMEALAERGVPQFGLSNMGEEVREGILALTPAFRHMRDLVISAETAVMKPDPRIFRQACDRFGLEPHEMFFVDDSARNVEGARALGFHVHHFTDPAALRPALETAGLL